MRTRRGRRISAQAAELAWAVPVVVGHRLARMAQAGLTPSARDQREFYLMGAEKAAAFHEAWINMTFAALRAQQQLALSMWTSLWFPWTKLRRPAALGAPLQRGALTLLAKGMAPVRRRALSNAKRLSRSRRRR